MSMAALASCIVPCFCSCLNQDLKVGTVESGTTELQLSMEDLGHLASERVLVPKKNQS